MILVCIGYVSYVLAHHYHRLVKYFHGLVAYCAAASDITTKPLLQTASYETGLYPTLF